MRFTQRLSALTCLAAAPTLVASLSLAPAYAAGLGQSQDLSFEQQEGEGLWGQGGSGWSGTVGLGLADVPVYPGASRDRIRVVPLLAFSYDRQVFLSPFGLGINLIHGHGFFAGPVLGFHGARNETDDPHLAGLGDIPASITGGAFAGYRTGPWQVVVTVRQAITHSGNGLEGLAELDYHTLLIPHQLLLAVGPEVSFGDAAHNNTWFGVSAAQSVSSGLPPFEPGGGIEAVGAHARLTTVLSRHLLLEVFGTLNRLTGDVGDSPIVERRTQGIIGAGLAYRF